MLLGETTMREFQKAVRKTSTLVVPFGTVEAHGVHLPINTDTLIIREVVKKASEKANIFMAPPVQYGVCTSTADHPGTIGITARTLRCVAKDIVRDGFRHGLRNFILISGHGGSLHIAALREACESLVKELDGVKMSALSVYELLGKEIEAIAETTNDSHAGELETSLVLYLAPGLVKGRAKEEYPNLPRPFIVKEKLKYWPGAVWGDPGKATAEKGERLFNLMVEKVVELAARIEKVR